MANEKSFYVRRSIWVGARRESIQFRVVIDLDDLPDQLFEKAMKNKSGETKLAYGSIRIERGDRA